MEFTGTIFGDRLPPEREPNPAVQQRIIHYFTAASSLNPEDLQPESPNNPIHNLTHDFPVSQQEDDLFIETLAKGGYDEISVHFFRDIVGKNSPLTRSTEKKRDDLHKILVNPILKQMGVLFGNYFYSDEAITIDPEEIERAKQVALNRMIIIDPDHQGISYYETKFRQFLYLHFGPAMEYSEQLRLLMEEAGIELPRPKARRDYWQDQPDNSNSHWEKAHTDSSEQTGQHDYRQPEPKKEPFLKPELTVLGIPDVDINTVPLPEFIRAVRKAYRRRALATHPDEGGTNAEMVALNNAHDALTAEIKKRQKTSTPS